MEWVEALSTLEVCLIGVSEGLFVSVVAFAVMLALERE